MPPTATARPTGQLTLQGQTVPAEAINPDAFFLGTRRKHQVEKSQAFAGNGNTDNFELLKADILAAVFIRFSGSLVITHSAGNVTMSLRWPYDLIRALRFTAQGVSNLINVSGTKLKAREVMKNPEPVDRGVSKPVGASTATQGTLSVNSESWGVGPGQVINTTQTVAVELVWKVPVAEDPKTLAGAIFMQTSAMDMTISIDWAAANTLWTVTGGDTAVLSGNVRVETEKFSIPVVGGQFVIPDLSLFHSLVQTNTQALQQGDNEIPLIGAGTGKTLLRVFYQVWAGATPAPLTPNDTNFGNQGWRYGSNETPEIYPAQSLREYLEHVYGSDVGNVFGFLGHEFAETWAFRDAVDLGQVSSIRLLVNLAAAPTNPNLEYVQETMFAAGAAA